MEILVSDNITIWQKYNPYGTFLFDSPDEQDNDFLLYKIAGINPTKIRIKDKWYDVIPPMIAARTRSKVDNYYRFIYIQININNGEYYIGKVNRKKLNDIKRYQGSGLKFVNKYKKHKEEFVRYFIASCNTAKQTEEVEASIVDEELLKDEKCLNLVAGGGGTSEHINHEEKSRKTREYMLAHPEAFQSMIQESRRLYCIGDSNYLRKRAESIKKTMSDDKYRKMMSERIIRWKEEHPEEYRVSREKNRARQRTDETRQKKRIAREEWVKNHPEEYKEMKRKSAEGNKTPEARKKHSQSLKVWYENNPEKAKENSKKRSAASVEVCRKPVHMTDLNTGEIIKTFSSQHEAAQWLVDNGYAKNTNCVSSINAVCQKKKCTTGYGYRKKAHGFGWEYAEK